MRLFLFTTCMLWCCTVTAAFHSCWRSSAHRQLRSFLTEDSCQGFNMSRAGGELHAVFYSPWSNEAFRFLLLISKSCCSFLLGVVFIIVGASRTRLRGTVRAFVRARWSRTWTGPPSGPLVFSTNSAAQVQAQLSPVSTFPSTAWKRNRETFRLIL